MDIAFIAKRYDTVGGTERDLYHLSDLLSRFGHQVTIYCQEVRVSPPSGISIKKLPFLGIGRTAKLWSLAFLGPKMAYQGGHDLVIGFTRILRQDIVRCGGGTHRVFLDRIKETEGLLKRMARILSLYHNSLLAIEKRQLQRGYLRILAISGIVKREIMDVYGVPEDSIEVIYDGIDTDTFNPDKKALHRAKTREEFGIPQDSTLILFLGNGFKRKGLETLLNSISLIKNKNVYCLVVGGDSLLQSYRELVNKLGIGEQVIFAGAQKKPERFYASADIFVLPSVQEAFGNAVLEAMACGVPVITTKVAGASELLTEGLERFILKDPKDAKTLAGMIDELLDPALRNKLAKQVREIAEGYTLEKNAMAIEKLCIRVLKEKT
jgi:UDP-glucose:(heptosyl)LPS alpha-1,3-glucosyltransferase